MSQGSAKKKGSRPTTQAPATVAAHDQCEPFPRHDAHDHVPQERGDWQIASGSSSGSSLISASPPRTPPSTAVNDEPAASTSTSVPPPSYQIAAGSSSDGCASVTVVDAFTRGVVDVRPKLTHERGQQSQKLLERKRTIDLKEDALADTYAEIKRLKADNVALETENYAYRKRLASLEDHAARLREDLGSLREEYHRLEKDSQAQIAVLKGQRDILRETQLIRSESPRGLYISNNIIEGNQGDVFTNWNVSMGGPKYLLPFLSPLSPLDHLEHLLSSPYIPLRLLTRLSFPGRRGGLYGVCVAESGTGLTYLSAQLIDESLRLVKSPLVIPEVDGHDLRILFGEETLLQPTKEDSYPNNAVLFAFCGRQNGDVTPNLFNITGLFLADLARDLGPAHPVRKKLNMRRERENRLRQLEIDELLIEISQSFDHIFVFLDAVHELPEGNLPSLLKTLERMSSREGVSLFLTRSLHTSPQDHIPGTWRFRPKRSELRRIIRRKIRRDRVSRPEAMNSRLMYSIVNKLSKKGS